MPVQRLVEVISSVLPRPAGRRSGYRPGHQTLGKTVIKAPDRSGFVVNALLVPFLLAAIRMLDVGYATAEDQDRWGERRQPRGRGGHL